MGFLARAAVGSGFSAPEWLVSATLKDGRLSRNMEGLPHTARCSSCRMAGAPLSAFGGGALAAAAAVTVAEAEAAVVAVGEAEAAAEPIRP